MAEFKGHDRWTLKSDDQIDGLACIGCGNQAAVMYPDGWGPRGQVFICQDCLEAEADGNSPAVVLERTDE